IPDAAACNLVFVNADEQARWPQLHAFLRGKSVLTVSDFSGFAASGGMIEFGHKNDHISAVINLDAVEAAHLQVENRLLRLVTAVHEGAQ
ncbi:MAG: YfiR family protein, partial [Pseudomonadota bacterium]|nr:YfiR family protein [Pseudomonadota bacterium]